MYVAALVLSGLGLLMAPAHNPLGRRLAWLAASRLGHTRMPLGRDHRAVGRAMIVGLSKSAGFLRLWWVSAITALSVVLPLAGVLPATLAAATAGVVTMCLRTLASQRAAELAGVELVAAVAALADEYSAGATVDQAFVAAASVTTRYRSAFEAAGAAAARGQDVGPALADPGLAVLGVACGVASRTGAPLTAALTGVQSDLEADRTVRRTVASALTGPRSSAVLLGVLPVIGLALGAALGAHPARVLLHRPFGMVALSAGVLLDLTGLMWTMRLATGASP